MMNNPIGWFEIYTNDLARARAFYEAVLETKLEALGDPEDAGLTMWTFPSDMEKYGSGGALVHAEGEAAGGNSVMVYFSCNDCAQEESRVEAAGGRVERPKMSIGDYGFITIAFDTEGNRFGLHSLQ